MSDLKLIFEFELNGNTYKIYETDVIDIAEDDRGTFGLTVFADNIIYIQRLKNKNQMLRSLKHELTHVWLYEFGHNQHDDNKTFNYEDVCEIVACSNDWINEIVDNYKKLT